MAICDARFIFTHIDIGSYGLIMTVVCLEIQKWENSFSKIKYIYQRPIAWGGSSISEKVPYYLVGDEAFPLQSRLLRPYPGQGILDEQVIFNYRLSRARRVTENAFGILSARWRIFMRPIQSNADDSQSSFHSTQLLTPNKQCWVLPKRIS